MASNMTLNLLLSDNRSANMKAGDKDMQRIAELIPLSKLNRGYAGKILSDVKDNDSVKVIVKNNEAEAVILSMTTYYELTGRSFIERLNKRKLSIVDIEAAGGALHKYAKPELVGKEEELYHKALDEKYK